MKYSKREKISAVSFAGGLVLGMACASRPVSPPPGSSQRVPVLVTSSTLSPGEGTSSSTASLPIPINGGEGSRGEEEGVKLIEFLPPTWEVVRIVTDGVAFFFYGTHLPSQQRGIWHLIPPGEPTRIARDVDVAELTVNETDVAWVGDRGVYLIRKEGGLVQTLAQQAMGPTAHGTNDVAPSIAADKDSVYWGSVRGLQRVAKEGGRPVRLAPLPAGAGMEVLGVDGERAYWVVVSAGLTGSFFSVPKAGGQARAVGVPVPGFSSGRWANDALYWIDGASLGMHRSRQPLGSIGRVSIEGKKTQVMVRKVPIFYTYPMAIGKHHMYWLEFPEELQRQMVVKAMRKDGGPVTELGRTKVANKILLTERYVIWAERGIYGLPLLAKELLDQFAFESSASGSNRSVYFVPPQGESAAGSSRALSVVSERTET